MRSSSSSSEDTVGVRLDTFDDKGEASNERDIGDENVVGAFSSRRTGDVDVG